MLIVASAPEVLSGRPRLSHRPAHAPGSL